MQSKLYYLYLIIFALSGCAVGSDFHPPVPDPNLTYLSPSERDSPQELIQVESIDNEWWKIFESDELNELVSHALSKNLTLAQAIFKLQQAKHDFQAQSGSLYPQVSADLDVTRKTINPEVLGIPNIPTAGVTPPFTVIGANVNVSYNFDFFGANQRQLESLMSLVEYQNFQLEAARLSLVSNLVSAVIRRAMLEKQIELSEQILSTQVRGLEIANKRYAVGGISHSDLITSQVQVEQAKAVVPPLKIKLAQAEHQIAIYLGETPATARRSFPTLDVLRLPAKLPLIVPTTLIKARPDIRASEALLHQASADIGVATANLYPQFVLSGSVGANGTALSHLSRVWSLGVGVTQPLFNGGQLRARLQSTEDVYQAVEAAYKLTVLQALQQVADVLQSLNENHNEFAAREAAHARAISAYSIANRRMQVGGVSEASLLELQQQEIQTHLDLTSIYSQRLTDCVALFLALGARS